jgi:hypothetical protein
MKYQSALEKTAIIPKQVARPLINENSEIGKTKRRILVSVSIELVSVISFSEMNRYDFILVCHDDLSDSPNSCFYF